MNQILICIDLQNSSEIL